MVYEADTYAHLYSPPQEVFLMSCSSLVKCPQLIIIHEPPIFRPPVSRPHAKHLTIHGSYKRLKWNCREYSTSQ